ncbi:MAG: hypothetical protein JWN67_1151 [Actinomycetia bacterium]|nr:hypothetical protein [Actinomycetes bacterium]
MSNARKTGLTFLSILALGLATLLGYIAGSDTSGAVHCKAGSVVSVEASGVDGKGNGTRTVKVGDCERLSDDAFIAVVDALVGSTPTTTVKPTVSTTTPAPKGS